MGQEVIETVQATEKGKQMTTQISINIATGIGSVTDKDRQRAETAALAVLGEIDPASAYAEFKRQWADLDSYDGMTGLAALWGDADRAADVALTDEWHNPQGASCSISA